MPTKKPRITAIVEQYTKDHVKGIASDEKKSESEIAGNLLEHGLKMLHPDLKDKMLRPNLKDK